MVERRSHCCRRNAFIGGRKVILREPNLTREDIGFITELCEDWPESTKGPVYESDVRDWIRLWKSGEAENGLIAEIDGISVGYVMYEKTHDGMLIGSIEIIVKKDLRGFGHGSEIVELLTEKLTDEGGLVAEFEAIRGAFQEKVKAGGFEKIGEGIGKRTGLPVVIGRVTV